MRIRLITLGVAVIGGVAALAAQLIATPQQLGVYDNVQFIRQPVAKVANKCAKSDAAAQKPQGAALQFVNFSANPQPKVQ
ncbi:MAG: hypothetical protein SFU83_07485 [Meiothermus sp.]|nr:hypothetical protein [Meiothermus sp.]